MRTITLRKNPGNTITINNLNREQATALYDYFIPECDHPASMEFSGFSSLNEGVGGVYSVTISFRPDNPTLYECFAKRHWDKIGEVIGKELIPTKSGGPFFPNFKPELHVDPSLNENQIRIDGQVYEWRDGSYVAIG